MTTSDIMETNYISQPSGSYTSPTITFPTDKDWTISTQGFNWPAVINFGIGLNKYSNYYTYAVCRLYNYNFKGLEIQSMR